MLWQGLVAMCTDTLIDEQLYSYADHLQPLLWAQQHILAGIRFIMVTSWYHGHDILKLAVPLDKLHNILYASD